MGQVFSITDSAQIVYSDICRTLSITITSLFLIVTIVTFLTLLFFILRTDKKFPNKKKKKKKIRNLYFALGDHRRHRDLV